MTRSPTSPIHPSPMRYVTVEVTPEIHHYLEASARIRSITVTRLVTRLLFRIAEDQLVLAVLDDESKGEPIEIEKRSYRGATREKAA